MKILIVDDNADDRKLLRLNLERHGCEAVIEARNGMEGLHLARQHRPDLIISDALMPLLDGFELLRALKSDGELKAIPFIFHSAVYTGLNDFTLALRLGAAAFISKPKEPEEFWNTVVSVLDNLASGGTSERVQEPLGEELEYLRGYSRIVATKLEEKVRELEASLAWSKAEEEELLKLSSAIEQSPVTIMITDARGFIEFVNPKFSQLTGYSPEEVLGKSPGILKSGETTPEEYRQLWETITAGKVWHGEFVNRKKNGELFREQATIAPVRNGAGTIAHYISIKEDITEKRKLEDQLRQAQKMETIGQIAGGVAHDFNNFLQAISTYGFLISGQLKEHGLPVTFVDELMAVTRRAVELTSSLLTFSRKQALNPKPVDLNRLLIESRKLLKRIVGEDTVLEVTPAPGQIIARADEGGMHQVLMNLVTNARDAMPRGGRLSISLEKVRPDDDFLVRNGCGHAGEFALITCEDSGEGISPEGLQRIFEPFYTTKGPEKGTGLGLAIIYGIIRQHNGFIEVDSSKGKGTTFRIYLPLLREQAALDRGGTEAPAPRGEGTILLVEDDAMVRGSLQTALASYGYTVLTAGDGEEGVRIFRENAGTVDLVVMDMIMPKKNGLEALREIRTVSPEVRAIFLSGYTANILESKGVDEEGELLLMKPVDPRILLTAIRNLLAPVTAAGRGEA
jgi:two-component system NtrC family sensor kinase